MKFDFFTFGGAVFWEDVFFYQKWRIQRHCFTKKYRLLDSWDIRRACGSFENCQRAFIKYIESCEITKQQGKMVILLHGYLESKNIFKPLWRKLTLTDSTIAALNYPSLFRSSLSSAHQILFFLNHLDDIKEISFVTNGAGSIVLQQLLNLDSDLQAYRSQMRLRNIVEINPVINENLFCEFLSRFKIFRFLLGPMLNDLTEKGVKKLPYIPNELNILRIFSPSRGYQLGIDLLSLWGFSARENRIRGKNIIYLKGTTFRTFKNEQLLNYTAKFINNGKI